MQTKYCLVLKTKSKIILYCINHLLNTTERTIPEFFLLILIFMLKKNFVYIKKSVKRRYIGGKG